MAKRLQLADLPESVLEVIATRPELNERHAREIVQLLPGSNLTPWLSRETAMSEIIDAVLKNNNLTAKKITSIVKKYNDLVALNVVNLDIDNGF